ncbi:MAG TPA: glycosyltransferase family 9 protein [Nevskiaceae bacterium]|nr:glycosyltransferase family 9 protein [Nevskiaceae bacterium]
MSPATVWAVAAGAYGDCLILLSLLERLHPPHPPLRVLGSGLSAEVAALLRRPLSVEPVLPGKAAFYALHSRGLRAGAREWLQLRRHLRQTVAPGDTVLFERARWRHRGLVPGGVRVIEGAPHASAYERYRSAVEQAFGQPLPWTPAVAPGRIRQVVVNPAAGAAARWLSASAVAHLAAACRERGWTLCLIDPLDQHGALDASGLRRLRRPALPEAVQALRSADLYIGPDSFFLHLAYYWRVPALGVFQPGDQEFLPPGSQAPLTFAQTLDPAVWRRALGALRHPVAETR